MFRINHNVMSINARRMLARSDREVGRAVERLSSGLRINRAADDAAGLFVSESMRAQIQGLQQAGRNVSNAITLLQTAEGGMEQVANMLIRLKELAIASADGTYKAADRAAIQREADALLQELDRIAQSTTFNGMSLLEGTQFTFQVHDTGSNLSQIGISIGPVTTGVILPGVVSSNWGFQTTAIAVIDSIEQGIVSVASVRTQIGAAQNRLERTLLNLQTIVENTTRALSVIRDADFAAETAALTRALILVQAGTSVLNQANLLPQNALSLVQVF